MNTDSIYRNTALEARLLVRTVVKADVLSGILMNKAALAFPVMSASVIMKTVVATTIHLRNTSRIILLCWKWMREAASPCKTADKTPSCIAPSYIPSSYVLRSLSHYSINPLYQYFCHVFGENEASRLFEMYRIGTSSKWGGATVFWQTDINGQVRTGKVMCYNAETGHRVKEPKAFVSWAHSELKLQDFHLKQCLFGEHLLKNSSSPVMLVESEKTAVVMSYFIPDYIWLATGGKNGCFNSEAMQVLRGREVTLIPDLGATEQWKEKSALLSGICKRVVVSNVLECTSDEEQRSQGLDIADFFLYSPSKRHILHQMIQRNPALQLLIDELDLELIE